MHSEHDVEADRGATAGASLEEVSIVSKKGSDRFDWCSGPRGMIVLFLKHVHLQKVGAAKLRMLERWLLTMAGVRSTYKMRQLET